LTWKIEHLEIFNFKFFKDRFKLELKRRHLLLYGENGSGKSSVYWSIYTLFQSCYKNPTVDDAMKYFLPQNDQNLRNKFSREEDVSGIKIVFTKGNNVDSKNYEDSNLVCNTNMAGDTFMRLTTGSSDFLNYKSLSTVFDFKNSQSVDIFSIIERESFPTLFGNPAAGMHPMGENEFPEPKSAEFWWRYLKENIVHIERCQNHKLVKKTSRSYKEYEELLEQFNSMLSHYIEEIVRLANNKLEKDFHIDAQLSYEYTKATIERQRIGPETDIDIKLCPPKIILQGYMTHPMLEGGQVEIMHPRSFFNEAKLTCISLALRLSMIDSKHIATDDAASVLVMDDLLVSLDMSMRLTVIDTILKYSDDYQLLMFTHDLTFFEIIKNKLENNPNNGDWCIKKLFKAEDKNAIPEPILLPEGKLLDKAKAFFASFDYAACANTLRRVCEIELRRLLPYNAIHRIDTENDCNQHEVVLKKMIDELYIRYTNLGMGNPTPDIQIFRKILMNPMSHGDVTTPIYREEVRLLLKDVETLCNIMREYIIDKEHCSGINKCRIELANDTTKHFINFCFLEPWSVYIHNGQQFFDNPEILMMEADFSKTICGDIETNVTKIENIYNCMCKDLFGKDNALYPPIFEVFTKDWD